MSVSFITLLTDSCTFLFFGTLGPGSLSSSSLLSLSDSSDDSTTFSFCFSLSLASAASCCRFLASALAFSSSSDLHWASSIRLISAFRFSSASLSSSSLCQMASISTSIARSSSSRLRRSSSCLAASSEAVRLFLLEEGADIFVFGWVIKVVIRVWETETTSFRFLTIRFLRTDQVTAFEDSGLNGEVLSRS